MGKQNKLNIRNLPKLFTKNKSKKRGIKMNKTIIFTMHGLKTLGLTERGFLKTIIKKR